MSFNLFFRCYCISYKVLSSNFRYVYVLKITIINNSEDWYSKLYADKKRLEIKQAIMDVAEAHFLYNNTPNSERINRIGDNEKIIIVSAIESNWSSEKVGVVYW